MKKINLKKIISLFLIIMMCLCMLPACSGNTENAGDVSILCTIFPIYDWVCEISKNVPGVNVDLLMTNGSDLHNYQISASDILKISKSDIFIYIGGESDAWVEEALVNVPESCKTVNLMEILGDMKVQESSDGISEKQEHDHKHKPEQGDEHETAYDEHI